MRRNQTPENGHLLRSTSPPPPPGPPAPTNIHSTPGPNSLALTWQHGSDSPRANFWTIEYSLVTRIGLQDIVHSPQEVTVSGTYSGTQTATLTGLPFDTDYSIRIQGVVAAPFQTAV